MARISEADLQRTVLEMCRLFRWKVTHFRPAQTRSGRWATPLSGDVGWPDLAMVHGSGRFMVRELKAEAGRLSDGQEEWLRLLDAAGVDAGVWRPSDLLSGKIESELRVDR